MTGIFARRQVLLCGAAALSARAVSGAQREPSLPAIRLPLWPAAVLEAPPTGVRETYVQRSTDPAISDRSLQGVSEPFIEIYSAARNPLGASVLIMPGGGYHHLAWDKEGLDVARWFQAHDVTAFVLAYRLSQEGWPSGADAPLADAQRAMRLVRQHAERWKLDPQRVAALGFSAGGHLCANLGAQHGNRAYRNMDEADSHSPRPALVAAIYPAIKLEDLEGALFGPATTPQMLAQHSPHRHVPADAPPHFLLHAEDDPLVSAEHSLALRAALVARNIPVETHLHARGGHGFGLRLARNNPLADWPDRLLAFGRTTQWLAA